MMAEKKLGLALGGGAARGLAHIGVLVVLDREGIRVDCIAGTSIGAIVGSIYACGIKAEKMKERVLELAQKRVTRFVDLAPPWTGLIRGNKLIDLLTSFYGGDVRFEDLRIPFACTATDIDTGEEVVLNMGSVVEAVRASFSLPGIFTVTGREDRHLVDGGLTEPVPVDLARKLGADRVIAVNVIPDVTERAQHPGTEAIDRSREPNIIHTIIQSLHIGTYSLVRSGLDKADVVIEPEVAHIGAGDFRRAQECMLLGETAAREALPRIKRLLAA
jgi:NTE family protein